MGYLFRLNLLFLLSLLSFSPAIKAQDITDTSRTGVSKNQPMRKFYSSYNYDAAFLQVASIVSFDRGRLSILRFSYFGNVGMNFNYDLNKHFGLFTGLGVKNIGFIDRVVDSTIKKRVYTIGAPVGFKIGNLQRKNFFMAGGGLDVPVHYKEKGFVNRSDKKKSSEWFSDQVSTVMPYVFAGFSIHAGVLLKFHYYPGDFLNTSYATSSGGAIVYPYANYSAQLMYVSIGISPNMKDMSRKKRKDEVPKRVM